MGLFDNSLLYHGFIVINDILSILIWGIYCPMLFYMNVSHGLNSCWLPSMLQLLYFYCVYKMFICTYESHKCLLMLSVLPVHYAMFQLCASDVVHIVSLILKD